MGYKFFTLIFLTYFVCVCVCVQAHQTVQTTSQKVHCTHLHGGDLGHIDWRAQVQVQQVTK